MQTPIKMLPMIKTMLDFKDSHEVIVKAVFHGNPGSLQIRMPTGFLPQGIKKTQIKAMANL